jgi:hypothetical protein
MSSARKTTDHDQIKKWVEERGGHPACVKGTRQGDSCLLRIDFPGFSGEDRLEEIGWDEFFKVFDDSGLAFLHQEEANSRFNKLVRKEAEEHGQGRGGR